MRRSNLPAALLALTLLIAPIPATAITPVPGTLPPSSQTAINNGSGNQMDPHVSGSIASYTADAAGGLTQIRYFDFVTNADSGIANAGSFDLLSDVGGSTIVFARAGAGKQAIMAFDVTAGTLVELDPVAGSRRWEAAIGGTTVAWIDRSSGSAGEIAVYDTTMGAPSQTITSDALFDRRVAVSPDGRVLAWEKCASPTANCEIYQAVKGSGGWTVGALTNTPEHESFPDTNGTIIVYGSSRASTLGNPDIFWTPVGGGPETQLELAGTERNPNISGDLILFERQVPGASGFDLFAYHGTTNSLYQLTNTPTLDESLNDVSVSASGDVRVVWSVFEGSDENVYGLSFQLPPRIPARVTLFPPTAVNLVGTWHTVAAEVTDISGSLVAATLVFQVTGSVSLTGTCVTGWNFQCALTYQGPQTPGTDVILAFADINGNGQLDTAVGPCPYFPCGFGEPWAYATKVWVASGVEAIDELITLVESLSIPRGIANSLRAKLESARRAADNGQVAVACRLLDAFKQEVHAQTGQKLTVADANQLLAAADAVKTALGCP